MRLALELARHGEGWVEPNPMVGCVLTRDGELIGQGFHRRFGGPHAEVEALRSCPDASGATAYVTLEPCCHHGKTPPCTEALITAGVRRVVVAVGDPFRAVDGGGIARLATAGIAMSQGVLESAARELNAPYFKRLRTGRPWVIAKWAMTLDGRIATIAGESQWITGEQSRRRVHQLRARMDAIATGMGTVVADDPLLTARPVDDSGQPETVPRIATRIVFCRRRLPRLDSRLVRSIESAPLVLVVAPTIEPYALSPLEAAGATLIRTSSADPVEMVDSALGQLGPDTPAGAVPSPPTNLMLEGGSELLASFFAAGQVDECDVYIGPLLFGGQSAPGPVGGQGWERLADARKMSLGTMERLENDIRLRYRVVNRG